MYVDWSAVNARRVGEKTQEVYLYCSQRAIEMTPRAFELAQQSFADLLKIIIDRDKKHSKLPANLLDAMYAQNQFVAVCSQKQAKGLAYTIVYKCMGDDLNLYPVRAEKKIDRAKVKGLESCYIPEDEMTERDKIYVAAAVARGESVSPKTVRPVYEWFQELGLNPHQARVYSEYYFSSKPRKIDSLPQQALFGKQYRNAAKVLAEKHLLREVSEGVYELSEEGLE